MKENFQEVQNRILAGATVVDVRTPEEFAEEHFPNALNIPVDQIQQRLAEFGDKHKPLVLYCASGHRSAFGTKLLRSLGFTDVVNAGGLKDMPNF